MKYKAKIAVLILVLSVFVLTTVFLFACGNGTDKNDGIDTTTPESTATTISTEVTASPEVTTVPKSETTAPETTVSQTEEVTTAPLPTKTEVVEFYTRHKAKATDIADSGYDIIDSLEKYNSYKTACMNDYTDGKKVFEEFEAAMELDGTQDFFDKYYIVSVSVRGYCLYGYSLSYIFGPASASISIKKDAVVFDYTPAYVSDKISSNGDKVFRTFCRIEKTYFRDNVKIIIDESQYNKELINLPYTFEQSAMLFDESDAHVGPGPLSYSMMDNPQQVQRIITGTRVEGVWENKFFDKTVQDIIKKYDEKFFENNVLFCMSIYTPIDNLFSVEDVYYLYNDVYVDVRYTLPEKQYIYDYVLEKVYTFIEIPKSDIPKEFWSSSHFSITLNFKVQDCKEFNTLYHKPEIDVEI